MKKKILSSLIAGTVMMLSVCAGTIIAGAEDSNPVGDYKAIALENFGSLVGPELLLGDTEIVLCLYEDGTSKLGMGDSFADGTWERDGAYITLKSIDQDVTILFEDGILKMDPDSNMAIVCAKEDADISLYQILHDEEAGQQMKSAREAVINKYNLKNDDAHIVYTNLGQVEVCEFDSNDKMIKHTCYYIGTSEEDAAAKKTAFEKKEIYSSVEQDGSILILESSDLEAAKELIEKYHGAHRIE